MTTVDLSRVPDPFHRYIKQVDAADLTEALRRHQSEALDLLTPLSEEQWSYRYAEGKWSIREVVQHLIDAERIFCFRALVFARKDKTPLPGFDENDYAAASAADARSSRDLLEELATVQRSSAQLFASFSEEQLNEEGLANGRTAYAGAMGYIIVGHTRHHLRVLRERYGI